MNKIELGKQYRTRSGHEVRLGFIDDAGELYPVHGWWKRADGWEPDTWTAVGINTIGGAKDGLDLIEAKPRIKRTVWLNLYGFVGGGACATGWASKDMADLAAENRLACVKVEIDCEHGEGL